MRQGLEVMGSQLNDARKQDLGTAIFPNWMYELLLVSREVQHTIDHLSKWMSATSVDNPAVTGISESYILKEPLGVVSVLGSWNYPYLTVLCPLVSVIAAGNCAIIKPSELSPWSSTQLKNFVARYLDTSCF